MQHMGPAKTVSTNSSTQGAVTPSHIENYKEPLRAGGLWEFMVTVEARKLEHGFRISARIPYT